MSSKSILIVSNMYPSESSPYAGIYVKNLYNYLKEAPQLNVDLLTMKRVNTGWVGSLAKYVVFFLKSIRYMFKRYDIVHLHFFYPLFLVPIFYKLLHPKVKLIVTFHGSDINKHIGNPIKKKLIAASITSFSKHVAVGKELRDTLTSSFNLKNIIVLPAGVNQNIFTKSTVKVFDERSIDILYVGSFTDVKGLPELVESLNKLSIPINFVAIGVGPYGKNLEALKATTNHKINVHYGMSQNEIANMYRDAKFLIVPSRSEAFGLVVSESMFCGTPVIGATVGGIKEQIEHNKNGYLIKPRSSTEIVKAISSSLDIENSEYERLVNKCLQANKQYALANILEAHLRIYNEC